MSKRTEVPFNIGVFGRWGEGKSSFLKMIEDQIDQSNSNVRSEMSYRTHIVKYDATEYSEKSKIWACILKELYTKFEEDKGEFGRLKFFLYRFWNKAKEKKWAYGINAFIFVTTIIFGAVLTKSIEASKLKEAIISSTLGIVPLILTITNIVIPAIKGQLKLAKPIANYVTSNMIYPSYDDELGNKENLKEDLNDLLAVWLVKNERIVIFVDEIDRCSDKGIIELLESLQLFLKVKDIVIVMAIDINRISSVVCKSDKNMLKHTLEYLEKYITLPIYLQEVREYNTYINSLLDKEENNTRENEKNGKDHKPARNMKEIYDNKYAFNESEEELIKDIIYQLNIRNHITLRKIKRLINILNLSKQMYIELCELRNNEERIIFEQYIRWFFWAFFNCEEAYVIEEETKYDRYKSYNTVKEIYKIINMEYFNSIKHEKILEEKKDVESNGKKLTTVIKHTIKETSKMENQVSDYLWLKRYVEDITISQLIQIKEISRLFVISEKQIV